MTELPDPDEYTLTHGEWFEDIVLERKRLSPARTITEADVVNFAGLTGDYSPIHTDEVMSAGTAFGTRIAHGLLGLCIARALCMRSNYTYGTGVASLAWERWEFLKPLRIGDTVRACWWATEKRESKSNAAVGIINERVLLVNSADQVLQQGNHTLMIRRRPS